MKGEGHINKMVGKEKHSCSCKSLTQIGPQNTPWDCIRLHEVIVFVFVYDDVKCPIQVV